MKLPVIARYGAIGVFAGFLLGIILTWLLGESVPIIGILGLFLALGLFGFTHSRAACPSCGAHLLSDPTPPFEAVLNLARLALFRPISCSKCKRRFR